VYDELNTWHYRKKRHVPTTVLAYVLEATRDVDAERSFLRALDTDTRTLLAPYYLERLRREGIRIERASERTVRLYFADVDSTCPSIADAINRHLEREYERMNRHILEFASPRQRHEPVSFVMSLADAADICSVLVSAPFVRGVDCSDAILVDIPRALVSLYCNIEHARFTSCKLKRVTHDIGKLSALCTLYLDSNAITTLPLEMSALSSLELLSLSSNRLDELPPTLVAGWRALRILNIGSNNLRELPAEELAALPSLRKLDARDNCLENFPRALQRSTSLEFVSLMNNVPHFERNEFAAIDANGILKSGRLQCFL
jgi:hypothetical protein